MKFNWLHDEVGLIQTSGFHDFSGPGSIDFRAFNEASVSPPLDYLQYAARFGASKLYRLGEGCLIGIHRTPILLQQAGGTHLIRFGHSETPAYFLISNDTGRAVIVECDEGEVLETTEGFESWLYEKSLLTKQMYSRDEWRAIVDGPDPFTEQELQIIEERNRYFLDEPHDIEGDTLLVTVTNSSCMTLPYLTLDALDLEGKVRSGFWADVSMIRPGQRSTIILSTEAVGFEVSEIKLSKTPQPEQRDRYWEFRFV